MSAWFAPVMAALDALPVPVTAFIRDDDAGWENDRLLALLDTVEAAGACIDLAAIPLAVSDPLVAELCARIDAAPQRLAVHQHGCAHVNHEAEGRKCEFGPTRSAESQRHDIRGGWLLLQHLFGARMQPIFTPPWNRCAPHTPAVLAELGFQALSRDRGAPAQATLPEIAVDVDWSRQLREGGPVAAARALADALRARAGDDAPIGLMLHHATMDAQSLAQLGELLARITRHSALRWQPMAALIAAPATTSRTPA
jgi:hypothetical protein